MIRKKLLKIFYIILLSLTFFPIITSIMSEITTDVNIKYGVSVIDISPKTLLHNNEKFENASKLKDVVRNTLTQEDILVSKYNSSSKVGIYDPTGYYKDYEMDFTQPNGSVNYVIKQDLSNQEKKIVENMQKPENDIKFIENEVGLGNNVVFATDFFNLNMIPRKIYIYNNKDISNILEFLNEDYLVEFRYYEELSPMAFIEGIIKSLLSKPFYHFIHLAPLFIFILYISKDEYKFSILNVLLGFVVYLFIQFLIYRIYEFRNLDNIYVGLFSLIFYVFFQILFYLKVRGGNYVKEK